MQTVVHDDFNIDVPHNTYQVNSPRRAWAMVRVPRAYLDSRLRRGILIGVAEHPSNFLTFSSPPLGST